MQNYKVLCEWPRLRNGETVSDLEEFLTVNAVTNVELGKNVLLCDTAYGTFEISPPPPTPSFITLQKIANGHLRVQQRLQDHVALNRKQHKNQARTWTPWGSQW